MNFKKISLTLLINVLIISNIYAESELCPARVQKAFDLIDKEGSLTVSACLAIKEENLTRELFGKNVILECIMDGKLVDVRGTTVECEKSGW
ncbi:MAG TPA: hypothetical protein VI911_00680 [Patescibacteria group bacterium]|nr:MAG: hypothetical protein A2381_16360 [Bdellovibrionales bacterium RIFOXYB1_FULL_37_110]HLD89533.1 hypothetical protein [Patescibacteria group bacterium]